MNKLFFRLSFLIIDLNVESNQIFQKSKQFSKLTEKMPFPLGDHVTHILLAEFDIDKGSSLAHQYPEATGTDEQ